MLVRTSPLGLLGTSVGLLSFALACTDAEEPFQNVPTAGSSGAGPAAGVGKEFRRSDQFVSLTRRHRDVDRPRFRVDDSVELGRKTSSRAAQSISLDPPFPPDASWCARTTEPSTIEPVSSTSSCSSWKILAQCPLRAQFENRL